MQPKINQNRSCFNCGSSSHLLRNCPTRADIKPGILRHLQHRRNPSEVLYTLADEFTEALSHKSTDINEINVDEQLSQILATTGDPNEETQDADDSQPSDIHLSPYVQDEFLSRPRAKTSGVKIRARPQQFRSHLETLISSVCDLNPDSIFHSAKGGSNEAFQGAVLDTGAARTVIGEQQARCLYRALGRKLRCKLSSQRFRFGDKVVSSLGQIRIRLPVSTAFIDLTADIVPLQVPLLLGLDVMEKYRMRVCTSSKPSKVLGRLHGQPH
jgi:hypothetical protein